MSPAELSALFGKPAPVPADEVDASAGPPALQSGGFVGWVRYGKPAKWRIACRAGTRDGCEGKLLDAPVPAGTVSVDRLVLAEGEKPWDIYRKPDPGQAPAGT